MYWIYSAEHISLTTIQQFQESRTCFPEVRFYSNPIHSLYINIKNVVCNIGDDADVFVTLYEPPGSNGKDGRFIRYVFMPYPVSEAFNECKNFSLIM